MRRRALCSWPRRGGGGGGRGRGGGGERFRERGRDAREWVPKREATGRLDAAGEHLYGAHPVAAALAKASAGGARDELHALYVQEGAEDARRALIGAAEALGVEVRLGVERHDLNVMAKNRPHNGVVLDAAPLAPEFAPFMEPGARGEPGAPPPPLWVVLDEVVDPQNLGAIVRSAHFFGAAGVVVATKNCAPLSPAASKASSGALELLPLLACNSLPRFLRRTREAAEEADGAAPWAVVGLAAAEKADEGRGQLAVQLPRDGAALSATAAERPTLLVVGSEGTGLRTLVERECTHLAHIASPTGGPGRVLVDSLNASNAVATALYQLSAGRAVQ